MAILGGFPTEPPRGDLGLQGGGSSSSSSSSSSKCHCRALVTWTKSNLSKWSSISNNKVSCSWIFSNHAKNTAFPTQTQGFLHPWVPQLLLTLPPSLRTRLWSQPSDFSGGLGTRSSLLSVQAKLDQQLFRSIPTELLVISKGPTSLSILLVTWWN